MSIIKKDTAFIAISFFEELVIIPASLEAM